MFGGMKSVLVAVILVVVALVLSPLVFDQVHDVQSDPASEVFAVSTGTGETTATVTLSKAHFHNDTTHITVSSDNSNDTPTVNSYDPNTKQVTIGGLAASATRNLTVGYEIDALAAYPGSSAIAGLIPLLFIVGVMLMAASMLWKSFAK